MRWKSGGGGNTQITEALKMEDVEGSEYGNGVGDRIAKGGESGSEGEEGMEGRRREGWKGGG